MRIGVTEQTSTLTNWRERQMQRNRAYWELEQKVELVTSRNTYIVIA